MQDIPPKAPKEVSVPEAASYLGVNRKVIYQLIDFGELRAVRSEGKIIIDGDSLEECRRQGKTT